MSHRVGLPLSKVRVGDEIVATGMGDGGRHEVANLRHGLALGHADMHQHAGLLTAGDSMGVGIFLALSTGDHHFNVTAFEGLQILRGDLFLPPPVGRNDPGPHRAAPVPSRRPACPDAASR